MKIDRLVEYLQCPYCKNPNLIIQDNKIICVSCNVKYDIIENIPILVDKEKLNKQEQKQAIWFDKHYSKFSQDKYSLEKWRQSMLKRIFEQDYKESVHTYLDIGCGSSGYTVIEGAKRNNWISFGSDISLEAMIRANNLSKEEGVFDKTAFVVCVAENLPFKKNIFDYISAISVLEHLEYDCKAIENIFYSLKSGGYIYICVPNTYLRMWPFLWPIYYYTDLKIGHKRHYSIEKLDNYFISKNKCKKNKVFYNGHLIKFCQLVFKKCKLIDDDKWWKMEKEDINANKMGVQLNVIYQKQ
ncbi:MAG: methyltransferase domain-containing protein [bacterium]